MKEGESPNARAIKEGKQALISRGLTVLRAKELPASPYLVTLFVAQHVGTRPVNTGEGFTYVRDYAITVQHVTLESDTGNSSPPPVLSQDNFQTTIESKTPERALKRVRTDYRARQREIAKLEEQFKL